MARVRGRDVLFYFNPPSSRCTYESEHIRKTRGQTDRQKERIVSANASQTGWPEWFLVFGVIHTHTHDDRDSTYSRRYVVHAHPVEAAKESPRDSSSRGRAHHVERYILHGGGFECFRVKSSCKCSFGRSNPPVETLEFLAGYVTGSLRLSFGRVPLERKLRRDAL